MSDVFPEPIKNLPEAQAPFEGIKMYLSQADSHQIVFMEFEKDTSIPEHSHDNQWEIVLSGKADVCIDGVTKTYTKGDSFFIPAGIKHHAKIYAGYSSFAYFDEKERYKMKK